MESAFFAIIEATKYEMPPAMLATSQGLATEGLVPMRPHDTANRVVRIPLHSRKYPGLYAVVDEADAELVSGYRWWPSVREWGTYAYTQIDGKTVYMQRLILHAGPGEYGDHINHDTLDNRRANLRICSNAENIRNRSGSMRGAIVPVLGVWMRPSGRFAAEVHVSGKKHYLGTFDTVEEAARARNEAAYLLHGDFASFDPPGEVS